MKPIEVDDATLAFPAHVGHLMPPDDEPGYKDYRDNWHSGDSWGFKLFEDWFYVGLSKLALFPKPGVDKDNAIRHIRAIMRSFEPQHEDKTAACAFLFEHWFESAEWTKQPTK